MYLLQRARAVRQESSWDASSDRLTLRLRDDCDFDDPEEVRGAAFDDVVEAMFREVWSVFAWRR